MSNCLRCGREFEANDNPAQFDHDFCETCLPIVMEDWRKRMTPPEPKAMGFTIQNTGDGFRTKLTTF